ADELRLVPAAGVRDIDFGILAGEAQRKPFLPLAAVAALPGASGDRARNVVDQPVRDLAQFFDRADAGFLVELALGGFPSVLTRIVAALPHLPHMGLVDVPDAPAAPTDADQPGCVDQQHADACPVGQVFVA